MVFLAVAVLAALAGPPVVRAAQPFKPIEPIPQRLSPRLEPPALHLTLHPPLVLRSKGFSAVLSAPVVLDAVPRLELKVGKFLLRSFGLGAQYRFLPWVALGASSNVVKPAPGQPLALQFVGLLQLRF